MTSRSSLIGRILRGRVRINASDERFLRLLAQALTRVPVTAPRIRTVRSISLSARPTKQTVGMTRFSFVDSAPGVPRARQKITFYSQLLDELSERAALGVIAHELAHAWLNEHASPEQSKGREKEADDLAREWGFGPELDALDDEAVSV